MIFLIIVEYLSAMVNICARARVCLYFKDNFFKLFLKKFLFE